MFGSIPTAATGEKMDWLHKYLFALPLICLVRTFHLSMCGIAVVLFRTEDRRKKFYEYYPVRSNEKKQNTNSAVCGKRLRPVNLKLSVGYQRSLPRLAKFLS